jgi:hypothetical protein
MATQPLPPDDHERDPRTLSHVPADAGAPIEALVAGTVGDRGVACGAPLSSDQRYCVVCGERRGAPRFSLPAIAAVPEAVSAAPPPKPPRNARPGSGTTLVAGVATLLLAVLVGVLIGHGSAGNATKTVAGKPTVIRVNQGAAPSASAAPTTAAGSSAPSSSAGSSSGASKGGKAKGGASQSGGSKSGASKSAAKQPPVDKKAAAAQQQAASKVTGGSGGAPPTVTVGQKASKNTPGVNKKTGKFDGSFFGG